MAGVWTRNYTNILASFFAGPENLVGGSLNEGTASYGSNNLTVRSKDGRYYKIACNPHATGYAGYEWPSYVTANMHFRMNYDNNSNYFYNYDTKIQLGSGANTGDLYETYQLNNPITSGLTMSNQTPPFTVVYDSTNHKYTRSASFGITNTSNSNKNISELAIMVLPLSTNSNSYGAEQATIIYYDTFETITLEPYESVVITISQSFPLINYQPYPTV